VEHKMCYALLPYRVKTTACAERSLWLAGCSYSILRRFRRQVVGNNTFNLEL